MGRGHWLAELPLPLRRSRDLDRLARAVADLESSADFHRGRLRWSLTTSRRLEELLDRPLRGIPTVHVAGSKGKGSVCLMAESLLRAQGLRTGLYLSPHVERWSERVQVAGRPTPVGKLLEAVEHVLRIAAPHLARPPTFFEVLTAAGFLAFRRAAVDVAVVETGLGGRLDCTNVLAPSVCVITSVEREHEAILGSDLCEIAREKAGILKRGVPAASGLGIRSRAGQVVRDIARRRRVSLWEWGREIAAREGSAGRLELRLPGGARLELPAPSSGPFAIRNAALAAAAVVRLRAAVPGLGLSLDPAALARGLRAARLPGRAELIGRHPSLYRDGAHTPRSLAAVVQWVGARHSASPPVLVLGMQRDKRLSPCLRAVRPWIGPLIATTVPGSRSHPAENIGRAAERLGIRTCVVPRPEEAVRRARKLAGNRGSVLVAGSFWLVGLFPSTL